MEKRLRKWEKVSACTGWNGVGAGAREKRERGGPWDESVSDKETAWNVRGWEGWYVEGMREGYEGRAAKEEREE